MNLLVVVLATQLYSSSFDSSREEDQERFRVFEQQRQAYDAATRAQQAMHGGGGGHPPKVLEKVKQLLISQVKMIYQLI